MNTISERYSSGALLVLLGAAAGLGISCFYYLTPLTGVDGTVGAALVIFSTAIMLLAALIHPALPKGALRFTIKSLIIADIICTFAAGYFLHEWVLMAAMVVALIGAVWSGKQSLDDHSQETQGAAA
ncbi:hypothetical protein [uncultured Cohaesibacter sp.]|uniref:hypothetical protein n=1 Tax=uncultured Cohaesibacter sp. TaxID=1002546 RepID=UPI0029C5FEB9|nr:hypothetical protein [uncultured Cohaesibacter sp.]